MKKWLTFSDEGRGRRNGSACPVFCALFNSYVGCGFVRFHDYRVGSAVQR